MRPARLFRPAAFAAVLAVVLSTPASGSHGPGLDVARLLPPLHGSAAAEDPPPLVQRYPYLIPRATEDRPDERTGSLVHLVYLLPAEAADEQLDRLGILEDSMRSVNHWMLKETGNLQWRLDTFTFPWDDPATAEEDPVTIEAIDVTFIRSDLPATSLNGVFEIQALLQEHGLDQVTKRYVTYVHSDGDGACGSAATDPYPFEDEGVPLVTRQPHAGYSAVYLDSDPLCRAREFATGPRSPSYSEVISGHELIHNDGLVPPTAPHHCPEGAFHLCTPGLAVVWFLSGINVDPERFDLMYPAAGIPLSQKQLDIGDDDYFRHPFAHRDLENSPFLERVA